MKRFLFQLVIVLTLCVISILPITALLFVCFPAEENHYSQELRHKFDLLERQTDKQRIILIGGSNVAFGFNSQILADSLNVDVINMGLHAGIGLKYMLDTYDANARKNDVLIIAPEYEHFYNKIAWGNKYLSEVLYMHSFPYAQYLNFQQWLGIIKHTPLNIQNRIEEIKYFSQFTQQEKDSIDSTYVYNKLAFNQYGDMIRHWKEPKHFTPNKDLERSSVEVPNVRFYSWLFDYVNTNQEKGVTVLFYPPVICETAYNTNAVAIDYVDSLLKAHNYSFICPVTELVYPDSLFYDTRYHIHKDGAEKRTLHLLELLQSVRN